MDPLALSNLRRVLNKASLETSKRLRRAEQAGTVLGEETLTEMMVLEILENLRNCREPFDVETYNHYQESQNGADLRIWLNLDDAVIGFSIQAKKATLDVRQRVVASSLDHLVGKAKKRQVDILIARSMLDMTNPVHLVYQSPSLGLRLGTNGGCYAMSSYLMDRMMRGLTRPANKTDLQHYRKILFPWRKLVDPPVPGHLRVPIHVVPRSPRTHADLINMFGSFGDTLGAGFYGAGQGAFRYGLKVPRFRSSDGDGGGPDGGGGGDSPDGGDDSRVPQDDAGTVSSGAQTPQPDLDTRREMEPTTAVTSERDAVVTAGRSDRAESVLFRSAPKRVIHIGEPMELGEFGTPLSIIERRDHVELPESRNLGDDGTAF